MTSVQQSTMHCPWCGEVAVVSTSQPKQNGPNCPTNPPPEIAELLRAGDVVPFLGAGVNLSARPLDAAGNLSIYEPGCGFLPSGKELAQILATRADFPSADSCDLRDLAKIASFYADRLGPQALRRRLQEVFAGEQCEPCDIHKYLAEIIDPFFKSRDIASPIRLAERLAKSPEPADQWLFGKLSDACKNELQQLSGRPPAGLRDNLSEDLNAIVSSGECLYAEPVFERADFPDALETLCNSATPHSGDALIRLNRLLLATVYEGLLAPPPAPLVIVTTNYDDLAETALRRAGRDFDLVVQPTGMANLSGQVLWRSHGSIQPKIVSPATLLIPIRITTVVYKMHGSIDRTAGGSHANFLITEEDYVDFLARLRHSTPPIPKQFSEHFADRQFLFLGYGLGDWNLRVILKILEELRRGSANRGASDEPADSDPRDYSPSAGPSWAIQHKPSPAEVDLWAGRKVDIYNLAIDKFVARMRNGG